MRRRRSLHAPHREASMPKPQNPESSMNAPHMHDRCMSGEPTDHATMRETSAFLRLPQSLERFRGIWTIAIGLCSGSEHSGKINKVRKPPKPSEVRGSNLTCLRDKLSALADAALQLRLQTQFSAFQYLLQKRATPKPKNPTGYSLGSVSGSPGLKALTESGSATSSNHSQAIESPCKPGYSWKQANLIQTKNIVNVRASCAGDGRW